MTGATLGVVVGFRNPIVAGLDLIRQAIRSPNFVTGVSGWSINRDGSAEFQDIVARGDLTVNTLLAGTAGGARIEITPTNYLQVYNSSNVLIGEFNPTWLKVIGSSGGEVSLRTDVGGSTGVFFRPTNPDVGHSVFNIGFIYGLNLGADRCMLSIESPMLDSLSIARINLIADPTLGSECNITALLTALTGELTVKGDTVSGSNEGVNAKAVTSGTDTTTSGGYVNLAGTGSVTSFSFVKRFDSTRIRVQMGCAAMYSAVSNPTLAMLGVRINAVDTDVAQVFCATLNERYGNSGVARITGVPAGTYTVQGRWKRVSGPGTLTRDANDWLTIDASEVN